MLCIRPYRIHGGEFPCGGCLPCRYNRRRMWTARIVLESYCHKHCSFLTLTYADVPNGHHGPPAPWTVSLHKDHLQGFFKRLRARGVRVRYFAVGEYGERSGRAHFHAALYGIPATALDLVQSCWEFGSVHLGNLEPDSAQYIAGYVCKKMISKEDYRKSGRKPEFQVSSRKPAIGATAIDAIAASWSASCALEVEGDVPAAVRINGSLMPIGQFLRRKLRERLGRDSNMPQEVRQRLMVEFLAEDSALRERRRENTYDSAVARLKITNSKRVI